MSSVERINPAQSLPGENKALNSSDDPDAILLNQLGDNISKPQVLAGTKKNFILDKFDKDGDGKLNLYELESYFKVNRGSYDKNSKKFIDSKVSVDIVTDDLKKYDNNGDGFIGYHLNTNGSEGKETLFNEGKALLQDAKHKQEQEEGQKAILHTYDKDGDGKINSVELMAYFKEHPGKYEYNVATDSEIPVYDCFTDDVKKCDLNHDGVISYNAYAPYKNGAEGGALSVNANILEFDKDGDGKLNAAELGAYFTAHPGSYDNPTKVSVGMLTDDIKKYDSNGDGYISRYAVPGANKEGEGFVDGVLLLAALDKDGDGQLNTVELAPFLLDPNSHKDFKVNMNGFSAAFITDDLKKYDINNDGLIGFVGSYHEAIPIINQCLENNDILDKFDTDGDRKLNAAELKAYFEANPGSYDAETKQFNDSKVSVDILTDDAKKYDKNNDGFINYNINKGYSEGKVLLGDTK